MNATVNHEGAKHHTVIVYINQLDPHHQINSHAFANITSVDLSLEDPGFLELRTEKGIVAVYAPGQWIGWHDLDAEAEL